MVDLASLSTSASAAVAESRPRPVSQLPLAEPRGVRVALIGIALLFLLLFLIIPLLAVFTEALREGGRGLFRGSRRTGSAGGDPTDFADGADRRAAERGVWDRRRLGGHQV